MNREGKQKRKKVDGDSKDRNECADRHRAIHSPPTSQKGSTDVITDLTHSLP